jgi:hypothetical protein
VQKQIEPRRTPSPRPPTVTPLGRVKSLLTRISAIVLEQMKLIAERFINEPVTEQW